MTLHAHSPHRHPANALRPFASGRTLPLALILALGLALSLSFVLPFGLPSEEAGGEAGAGMDPDGRWISPAASPTAHSAESFPGKRFTSPGEAGAGMDPDGRWSGLESLFGQPGDAGAGMDPDGRRPLNWG
ncbi:MAG: hypothetical protein AAGD01_07715 [Acidobacteriota bacterium]